MSLLDVGEHKGEIARENLRPGGDRNSNFVENKEEEEDGMNVQEEERREVAKGATMETDICGRWEASAYL